MPRQTSKGTCTFGHRELSKASMTRHLQSCEQRAAVQGERESRQKAQQTTALQLVVKGYRLPRYWMHLQVAVDTTLATLDRFLRETWLECCGHVSVLSIGGLTYYADAERDASWWDRRRKTRQVKLEAVLSPGQTCSYE
jgi:protein-S-isoprenylcysteine O-methyltransferase Ste14